MGDSTANGHGREALSVGAKGFLGKPYHLKEVAGMVRKVLDEKPNQTQSP
jgi:DNA-binding response OmpR family regulator